MAKKKKASKKQLAALAKGRAKRKANLSYKSTIKTKSKKRGGAPGFGRSVGYGVTREFYRGQGHPGHSSVRKSCKHCGKAHSTSQHNAHAFYGEGSHLTKLVPAYKLTHSKVRGHKNALKTIAHVVKGAMKSYR